MFRSNVPFGILEGERDVSHREREREGERETERETKRKSVMIRHYNSIFCFYICPSSSAT